MATEEVDNPCSVIHAYNDSSFDQCVGNLCRVFLVQMYYIFENLNSLLKKKRTGINICLHPWIKAMMLVHFFKENMYIEIPDCPLV